MAIQLVSKLLIRLVSPGFKATLVLLGIGFLLVGCATNHSLEEQSIRILETRGYYELSVPVSQVVLRFPKGNLVRANPGIGGGTSNPRYFYFVDDKLGYIISGWFEPESLYKGHKAVWEETKSGFAKVGLAEPQKVSFEKQGAWDVVFYSLAGQPNMRANRVLAGTWVELHFSLRLQSPDSNERLLSYLKTVQLEIKPAL
ncbi:MAG: hypothetical protein U1F76_16200 [Candidatus Competibacteraceae bacterium]